MTAAGIPWFALSTLSFLLKVGAVVEVSDVTPPVCRVVNGSLDCPFPCSDGIWEVTVLLVGRNGTKVGNRVYVDYSDMVSNNVTSMIEYESAIDENGYNATLLTYRGSCCEYKVKISALDNQGNEGFCDFRVRWPNTMTTQPNEDIRIIIANMLNERFKHYNSLSNSPKITVSIRTIVLLLALAALLSKFELD